MSASASYGYHNDLFSSRENSMFEDQWRESSFSSVALPKYDPTLAYLANKDVIDLSRPKSQQQKSPAQGSAAGSDNANGAIAGNQNKKPALVFETAPIPQHAIDFAKQQKREELEREREEFMRSQQHTQYDALLQQYNNNYSNNSYGHDSNFPTNIEYSFHANQNNPQMNNQPPQFPDSLAYPQNEWPNLQFDNIAAAPFAPYNNNNNSHYLEYDDGNNTWDFEEGDEYDPEFNELYDDNESFAEADYFCDVEGDGEVDDYVGDLYPENNYGRSRARRRFENYAPILRPAKTKNHHQNTQSEKYSNNDSINTNNNNNNTVVDLLDALRRNEVFIPMQSSSSTSSYMSNLIPDSRQSSQRFSVYGNSQNPFLPATPPNNNNNTAGATAAVAPNGNTDSELTPQQRKKRDFMSRVKYGHEDQAELVWNKAIAMEKEGLDIDWGAGPQFVFHQVSLHDHESEWKKRYSEIKENYEKCALGIDVVLGAYVPIRFKDIATKAVEKNKEALRREFDEQAPLPRKIRKPAIINDCLSIGSDALLQSITGGNGSGKSGNGNATEDSNLDDGGGSRMDRMRRNRERQQQQDAAKDSEGSASSNPLNGVLDKIGVPQWVRNIFKGVGSAISGKSAEAAIKSDQQQAQQQPPTFQSSYSQPQMYSVAQPTPQLQQYSFQTHAQQSFPSYESTLQSLNEEMEQLQRKLQSMAQVQFQDNSYLNHDPDSHYSVTVVEDSPESKDQPYYPIAATTTVAASEVDNSPISVSSSESSDSSVSESLTDTITTPETMSPDSFSERKSRPKRSNTSGKTSSRRADGSNSRKSHKLVSKNNSNSSITSTHSNTTITPTTNPMDQTLSENQSTPKLNKPNLTILTTPEALGIQRSSERPTLLINENKNENSATTELKQTSNHQSSSQPSQTIQWDTQMQQAIDVPDTNRNGHSNNDEKSPKTPLNPVVVSRRLRNLKHSVHDRSEGEHSTE